MKYAAAYEMNGYYIIFSMQIYHATQAVYHIPHTGIISFNSTVGYDAVNITISPKIYF